MRAAKRPDTRTMMRLTVGARAGNAPGGSTPRSVTPFPIWKSPARKLHVICLTHRYINDIARQCFGEKARPCAPLQFTSKTAAATKGYRAAIPLFDREEPAQLAQGTDRVYATRE